MPGVDAAQMGLSCLVALPSRRARLVLRLTHMPMSGRAHRASAGDPQMPTSGNAATANMEARDQRLCAWNRRLRLGATYARSDEKCLAIDSSSS
jgi:hypothetical protein